MLTPSGSASVLHDVNSSRSNLSGINKRPLPPGQVTTHSNGNLTVKTNDGRTLGVRPNGTLASFSGHGQTAAFRANGQVRSVHTPTMDIARNAHGQRTVVVRRSDHTVVVSTGRNTGYVQRSVVRNGQTYVQRTYVMGGARYTRVYTTYNYHGVVLNQYVPAYYYAPAFYGWAYYPWQAPVPYAWAWMGAPWYAAYGPYFSVWPTYPSPAFWLTDYLLGQTLSEAYLLASQREAAAPGGADATAAVIPDDDAYAQTATPITPELKQAIAQEVQQQLAYENAAAANPAQAPTLSGLPQVMVPNHLFVAATPLNVATANDQVCAISPGDVLRLLAKPPDDSAAADLAVASSRQGDCPAGAQVSVALEDLQEMQNSFRARLDAGLQTLHSSQGQGGLPPARPSAIAPPPRPADDLPPDDVNVQAQLQAAQQQANQTESQVTQDALAAQVGPGH